MTRSITIRNASIREAVWNLNQTLGAQDRQAKADAERTLLTATGQPVQFAMAMPEVHTGFVRTVIVHIE